MNKKKMRRRIDWDNVVLLILLIMVTWTIVRIAYDVACHVMKQNSLPTVVETTVTVVPLPSPLPEDGYDRLVMVDLNDNDNNEEDAHEMRLTIYHHNDELDSTAVLGTGINVHDLPVNQEYGYHVFYMDGIEYMVVAAATNECLRDTTVGCGSYNSKHDGYVYYNYYDTLKVTVDGIEHNAIVLDSCGACMAPRNGEKKQRLDVLVPEYGYKFKDTKSAYVSKQE